MVPKGSVYRFLGNIQIGLGAFRASISPKTQNVIQERGRILKSGFQQKPLRQTFTRGQNSWLIATIFILSIPALVVGQFDKNPSTQLYFSEPTKLDDNTGLPLIRLADVQKHGKDSPNPWVTRGDSVYDITDWVAAHPGQGTIVNPFFADPERDGRLLTLTSRPRCAETPGDSLKDSLTENGTFYVRNHMWVPQVNEATYELTIELNNGDQKSYSLHDLKHQFKQHTLTSTLQCAGNRRKNMTTHAKKTNGLQWTTGAISTAEWEGVRLRDTLEDAGLNVRNIAEEEDAKHAQFVGLEAYGGSIPIDKAIDANGDVLLALKMNGEDLPPDHGYPLRVVVPGSVAARSVKWLKQVFIWFFF